MSRKLQNAFEAMIRGRGESEAHTRRHTSGRSQSLKPEIAATATRTRMGIQAENAAAEGALCAVLGPERAAQLLERAQSMPVAKPPENDFETPTQRALRLMETREGRAKLATLTWETV